MGFFRDVTTSLLDGFGLDRVHVVGHSMGGLTGLLLASDHPDRVESLTSIEGNLAPEDCFMSRQIVAHPARKDDVFLDRLAERMRNERICGQALYTASLAGRVDWMAVRPIFTSMIRWSERGDLLEKFQALSMPRMFIHGSSNRTLSYLPELARSDVRVQEIPQSGHFPMYSNPVGMWNALASFLVPYPSAA